ncbi:electron transport complex protein RnfC [Klebsiella grimontii]|nr:electron transport complex protein RnfC [Klebsiella grimontii]
MSVIIDADGEDRWIERDGWYDYQNKSREALIERIHQFGVAGLGGAGSRPAPSCAAAATKSTHSLSTPPSASPTSPPMTV